MSQQQQQTSSASLGYPIQQHDYGTLDMSTASYLTSGAVGMHGPYTTPMTSQQQLGYQHSGSACGVGGNQLTSYPPPIQHSRTTTGMTTIESPNVNMSGGPSNNVSVPSNVTASSTVKSPVRNKNSQQKTQRNMASGSTNGVTSSKNEHKNSKQSAKQQHQQNKTASAGTASDVEIIFFIYK